MKLNSNIENFGNLWNENYLHMKNKKLLEPR